MINDSNIKNFTSKSLAQKVGHTVTTTTLVKNTSTLTKRFYPGHIGKILKALKPNIGNNLPKIPPSQELVKLLENLRKEPELNNVVTPTENAIIKPLKEMVYRPNAHTIDHHDQHNYFIRPYIKAYQAHNFKIPFIVSDFTSLIGTYTLSDEKFKLVKENNLQYASSISYLFMKYCFIMYAKPITKPAMLQETLNSLLTQDTKNHYPYPKNSIHGHEALFPLLQHFLAADTHNLVLKTSSLNLHSHIILTEEFIPLVKYLEILILSRSHKFLLEQPNSEIIIINPENKQHQELCNAPHVKKIISQAYPDGLGINVVAIPGQEKHAIPVEVKLRTNVEATIKLFTSFSSISPNLQKKLFMDRIQGALSVEVTAASKQKKNPRAELLQMYYEEVSKILKTINNKKLSLDDGYNKMLSLNENILLKHCTILELYPTFVTNAHIDDVFSIEWQNNKEKYDLLLREIKVLLEEEITTVFQKNSKYNVYAYDLLMLKVLKKMEQLNTNYTENYYALRSLLQIIDGSDII